MSADVPLVTLTGPASATHGTICGRVVEGGEPIAGAHIELLRNDGLVARTISDAAGRYIFSRVPHGDYRLRVTPDSPTRFMPAPETPVASAPTITRAEIKVQQIAVLGTITDKGHPVSGVEVRIGDDRTWTDDAGAYRLAGVEPGQRELVATRGNLTRRKSLPVPTNGPVDIDLST